MPLAFLSTKSLVVIEEATTGSLKLAVTAVLVATPVVLDPGVSPVTAGAAGGAGSYS